jgi:4-hydroxy-tetrahydrodipicolinate synthase
VAKLRTPLTSGVACATLTPLDDDGTACLPLLASHCRLLLDAGCGSIVLLGTTGEANSFTVAERIAILEGVLAAGIPAGAIIVGAGCCAVGDSVALSRHALSSGCTRVLMLPPFYYKNVSDAGVVDAFSRTIESIGDDRLHLYLYRIPQLSGVDFSAAAIDELRRRHPGIIAGLKDSSGDRESMVALCLRFGPVIDILAGSERFLLDALAAGASGCVSATANATAALISELYRRRDDPSAGELQQRATDARSAFEGYPLIAALKEFTARRTGDRRWRNLRPPLEPLTDAQSRALFDRLATLHLRL